MSNVELATAYITLVPSMKGSEATITQDLGNVGAAAGATASRGFLGTITGAVGGVVGVAAKGTALIGGLIGGMAIKGGISRQLQIEDATAKLSGLGHSSSEVTAIMGNALAAVKGTAFGLGEAGTVAAGAVAAGIKPGTDLQRILGLTADTATITGASMSDMGAIFNKVAANGKLTLGDVNQLQDRGFPILQMVAKQYGVTAAAASQMVTDGKVDFAHFADAIQAGVGGAALKSGDTTRGAFANMGAAISRFGVVLTSGFYPLAKLVFNQITQIFDGMNAKLTPLATVWAATFQGKAIPIIAGFSTTVLAKFNILIGGITALVAAFQAGGDDVTSSGFAGGMERVGLGLRAATDFIKQTWDLFTTGWKAPPSLAAMFRPEDIQGATAFGIGLHAVVTRITGDSKEVGGGIRAFGAAFQAGGDDITSSGFAGVMEHIGLFARAMWDKAQPVFAAIGLGWNRLMLGLQSGNFSGVGGNVVQLFTAISAIADPMRNVLVAVGSNIGSVGTQFGNLIAGALPLIAPLLQGVADVLKFLADHSQLILPIIGTMVAAWLVYKAGVTAVNFAELAALPIKAATVASNFALAGANRALADSIAVANGEEKAQGLARLTVVPRLILQTAATVAHGVAVGAMAVATGVATAAQWLWNAAMDANPIMLVVIAIAALVAGVIWAYNSIGWFKDGLNAAWAFISSVTMTVLGAVGAFFVALWQGIVSVAVGIFNGFIGFVGGAWNGILSVTAAVLGAVGNFFTGLWRGIVSLGTAIIVGYVSFILGAWNNVFSFTSSVFSGIANFLGGIWGNIVNGASGMIGNLIGFFTGLPGRIMGALAGAGGWLVSAGRDIINGLISGIQGMMGAIGNAILSLIPGPIVGVFKAALGIASPSKVFRALARWIPAGVVQGVTDGKPDVAAAVQDLVSMPTAQSISAGATAFVPSALTKAGIPTAATPGTSTSGLSIEQNIYPQPGQSEELIGEYSMRQLSKAGLR